MKRPAKNALEWTVFAASALLILAVAGWLVYAHINYTRRPPAFEIATEAPVEVAGGFAVPVIVVNVGDRSASLVRIEVVLAAGAATHRSEAEIELIPYRSKRRAWVTFPLDPRRGALASRVIGFEEP